MKRTRTPVLLVAMLVLSAFAGQAHAFGPPYRVIVEPSPYEGGFGTDVSVLFTGQEVVVFWHDCDGSGCKRLFRPDDIYHALYYGVCDREDIRECADTTPEGERVFRIESKGAVRFANSERADGSLPGFEPEVSVDGRYLLFGSGECAHGSTACLHWAERVDADPETLTYAWRGEVEGTVNETWPQRFSHIVSPALSEDGEWLYFNYWNMSGEAIISRGRRVSCDDPEGGLCFDLDPEAGEVLADVNGLSPDGTVSNNVTNPALSPDGRRLFFKKYHSFQVDIRQARLASDRRGGGYYELPAEEAEQLVANLNPTTQNEGPYLLRDPKDRRDSIVFFSTGSDFYVAFEDYDQDDVPEDADDNGRQDPADDNCPHDYNPAQRDTDEDGRGDVCDPCTDADGDGLAREGGECGPVDDDDGPRVGGGYCGSALCDDCGDPLCAACDRCEDHTDPRQTDGDGGMVPVQPFNPSGGGGGFGGGCATGDAGRTAGPIQGLVDLALYLVPALGVGALRRRRALSGGG